MIPADLLRQHGINLKSYAPGQHYTTCPQCSRDRRKRKAECLSVLIDGDRACWNCHHCGWCGPQKGDGASARGNGADRDLPFHIYRDKNGTTLFRKVRNTPGREPKCWFEHQDSTGKWVKGAAGADTSILYRADEVAKAIAEGRRIICAEGEKDVDNLWHLGFAATCNAHGASGPGGEPKWTKRHSEQLRGADIVVLNDNDHPGYAHAEATCKLAVGVARNVKRLDLKDAWLAIPDHGDVSDWIAQGHTRDELEALIASASDYAEPKAPDRTPLLLANWIKRELPPRDYLLGDVLCTTSRWVLIGDSGIGKTLLAMAIAGAVGAGAGLLGWSGSGKQRRVMIFDGEMPAETFKERMENVARQFGDTIEIFGYNRDVLDDDEMPPFNTPEGEAWLIREIEAIKPDLIILDSIMCLTIGLMSDEESWAPIKPLMRKISSMRIAQVWLHHTGHDASKGFGTKTREWQVDTVAILLKTDDDAIELRFNKARLRTPQTAEQFAPKLIRCEANGWVILGDGSKGGKGNQMSMHAILRANLLRAYDRLADGAPVTGGYAGEPVRKVKTDGVRDEMRSRGFLDVDEKGRLRGASRMGFLRAKAELITQNTMVEADGMIWRIRGRE